MFIKRNLNSRDKAIDLVEDGMVSAEDMMKMCLQYMSTDDVDEMLDANELSERFMEEDYAYLVQQYDHIYRT